MAVKISTGAMLKQKKVVMKNADYTVTPTEVKTRVADVEETARGLEPINRIQLYPAVNRTVSTTDNTGRSNRSTWRVTGTQFYDAARRELRVGLHFEPIEWESMEQPESFDYDLGMLTMPVRDPYTSAEAVEIYFEPDGHTSDVDYVIAAMVYDSSGDPKQVVTPVTSAGRYGLIYQMVRGDTGEIVTASYSYGTDSYGLYSVPLRSPYKMSGNTNFEWCLLVDDDMIKYTERTQTTADISVKFQEVE